MSRGSSPRRPEEEEGEGEGEGKPQLQLQRSQRMLLYLLHLPRRLLQQEEVAAVEGEGEDVHARQSLRGSADGTRRPSNVQGEGEGEGERQLRCPRQR